VFRLLNLNFLGAIGIDLLRSQVLNLGSELLFDLLYLGLEVEKIVVFADVGIVSIFDHDVGSGWDVLGDLVPVSLVLSVIFSDEKVLIKSELDSFLGVVILQFLMSFSKIFGGELFAHISGDLFVVIVSSVTLSKDLLVNIS